MNEIIREWNAMSTEEQIKMITACVHKAANMDIGGYALRQGGNEIDEFVNEAWERVTNSLQPAELAACNERRAAKGKQPTTLISLVYRSARAAVTTLCRREIKLNSSTETSDKISDYRAPDDMEATAIIKVDLEQFKAGRDALDQKILELVVSGYTEREIAAEVLISNVAVHKRIVKMRNELVKAIA